MSVDDSPTVHPDPVAALEAVRCLHSKRVYTNDYMAPHDYGVCAECRQLWPCATEQAIREASEAHRVR